MLLTTTIPYVNARPHLGFLLELVQADVLARHHRRRGTPVRLQTGTDDNSLKNVLAADAAGVPTGELVDRNAAAFVALHEPYSLSFDDVVHTSRDPRHRAGVERLWRATAHDLYRKHYEGRYCVGCEQFYTAAELTDGRCPEHDAPPERVVEENWFFRLSRYADAAAGGDRRPAGFASTPCNAATRCSASSPAGSRTSPSPGTPPAPAAGASRCRATRAGRLRVVGRARQLRDRAGRGRLACRRPARIHLLGKGVLRFHAVYWPALLLSAGLPLPTDLVVHDYLTVDGRKISKSGPAAADPAELAERFGADAVRWWLLRDVPRVGDTDFTAGRLVARANDELANGIGNLVHRVTSMVHRYRDGVVPDGADAGLRHRGGRRRAGGLRLPARIRCRVGARHRGEPVHQPHPAVGRRRAGTRCRARHAGRRVSHDRGRAGAVPAGDRCPHRAPVHAGHADGQRLPVPERLFSRLDLATTGPNGLA